VRVRDRDGWIRSGRRPPNKHDDDASAAHLLLDRVPGVVPDPAVAHVEPRAAEHVIVASLTGELIGARLTSHESLPRPPLIASIPWLPNTLSWARRS
jgi:hypothetical protein